MTTGIDFQVKIDQAAFDRWIEHVAFELKEKVSQKASNAAASVFAERVRESISSKSLVRSGTMLHAVFSGKSKRGWPDGVVASYVGIKGGYKFAGRYKGNTNISMDAFYWRFVEAGHFLRNAEHEQAVNLKWFKGRSATRDWLRKERKRIGAARLEGTWFTRDAFPAAKSNAERAFFRVVDTAVRKWSRETK